MPTRPASVVHPYRFRNENGFLPPGLQRPHAEPGGAAYGDAFAEYRALLMAGVDGLFTDNPDTAVEARAGLAWGVALPYRVVKSRRLVRSVRCVNRHEPAHQKELR